MLRPGVGLNGTVLSRPQPSQVIGNSSRLKRSFSLVTDMIHDSPPMSLTLRGGLPLLVLLFDVALDLLEKFDQDLLFGYASVV